MADVVLFGAGQVAEVAWAYFTYDSPHRVVGFCVDAEHRRVDRHLNLPVVDFERVTERFPPERVSMFLPISYRDLNRLRARKVMEAKLAGYTLLSYVSSRATVWPGLEVGENCFILEHNVIQPFARLGDNVTLWSGNHIGHHSHIERDCFIASHVVVSGSVSIGPRCFVGVNATFHDNVSVGADCIVAAGAVVSESLPAGSVLVPARSVRLSKSSREVRL